MFILYFYDLKPRKGNYNRLKRVFYYRLNQLKLNSITWRTNSVLVVPEKLEAQFDAFFQFFKNEVEVYKARTDYIEELSKY